jgi:hypothetical protein
MLSPVCVSPRRAAVVAGGLDDRRKGPIALGMQRLPRAVRAVAATVIALGVIAGLAASACVYDSSQRCGPAMTYVEAAHACVCDANAVAVVGGCTPCAADEVAAAGKCACPTGQTKNAENQCRIVAGLGDACDTQTQACTSAAYPYCAPGDTGTAGTCTKTCASNADCDPAYTCATWEAQPYCRTFEGAGASCASAADCTGDANSCDTFQTHTCVVADCSVTKNDCPRGTMCCDFSSLGFGTVCAGACQ